MILPFLVMSEVQAARFREETANDENRLDPRMVEGGRYKGQYVLPERVMMDPAHEARRDAFRMLTSITMDTDVAFPITEALQASTEE